MEHGDITDTPDDPMTANTNPSSNTEDTVEEPPELTLKQVKKNPYEAKILKKIQDKKDEKLREAEEKATERYEQMIQQRKDAAKTRV